MNLLSKLFCCFYTSEEEKKDIYRKRIEMLPEYKRLQNQKNKNSNNHI